MKYKTSYEFDEEKEQKNLQYNSELVCLWTAIKNNFPFQMVGKRLPAKGYPRKL